ncbi:hypothetical protein ACFVT5_40950 [Streptomyces sp. NPDC058001]|uniref:hypothetical protein n=1 Tax=Streptomyces sp. NPDC058001 TaxID=3346300 RepID=UPI0036DFF349
MKIPAGVEAMLREGRTNQDIAARAHTSHRKVAQHRADLGLPKCQGAPPASTAAEAFAARTRPTPDGHLDWTGTFLASVPSLHVEGRQTSARRLAFRLRYGREPVGNVLPGCGYSACVHPDHIEDKPMRQQYAAIFGEGVA